VLGTVTEVLRTLIGFSWGGLAKFLAAFNGIVDRARFVNPKGKVVPVLN
jgi:hypothetical protein